jgi:hypothetical protein
MRRTFRWTLLAWTLLAATVAVAIAACGTQSATTTGGASGTAGAQTPKQRAEADAAAMLRAFVPPPGAKRLSGPPDLPGGVLKRPITYLGDATQANGVVFWEAPGDPQALIAWEEAHIAKRFTLGDADFGPPAWDRMFQLPPIPGVLTSRSIVMEAASMGGGETGIRVDAEVGWQPPRTASTKIPPTATVVTIAEQPNFSPNHKRLPTPVTITDQKVVRKLVALINALPISPLNNVAVSCPATMGIGLDLTFRAKPGGQVLAQALTGQACAGGVALILHGTKSIALNRASDKQILDLAGLRWKLPTP